jgi:hypothetical protein
MKTSPRHCEDTRSVFMQFTRLAVNDCLKPSFNSQRVENLTIVFQIANFYLLRLIVM